MARLEPPMCHAAAQAGLMAALKWTYFKVSSSYNKCESFSSNVTAVSPSARRYTIIRLCPFAGAELEKND